MSVAKFALAGMALLAMGAAYGAYHLNFERRTPVIYDATGYPLARIWVADATVCFAAKLASKTDEDARHAWDRCERYLDTHGALEEFNRNFAVNVGSGVAAAGGLAGLVMLAAFSGRRPRHLRGPKKLTGIANYQRLARILFKEAKQSGQGHRFFT